MPLEDEGGSRCAHNREYEPPLILPMSALRQPHPIGHIRTRDKGAIVDVRTWAEDPSPACQRCGVCTVLRAQTGNWQCVQIELPRSG